MCGNHISSSVTGSTESRIISSLSPMKQCVQFHNSGCLGERLRMWQPTATISLLARRKKNLYIIHKSRYVGATHLPSHILQALEKLYQVSCSWGKAYTNGKIMLAWEVAHGPSFRQSSARESVGKDAVSTVIQLQNVMDCTFSLNADYSCNSSSSYKTTAHPA